MNDDCKKQIPLSLSHSIDRYDKYRIKFGDFDAMQEYVASRGLTISQKDTHPNLQGHEEISDYVIRNIREVVHV